MTCFSATRPAVGRPDHGVRHRLPGQRHPGLLRLEGLVELPHLVLHLLVLLAGRDGVGAPGVVLRAGDDALVDEPRVPLVVRLRAVHHRTHPPRLGGLPGVEGAALAEPQPGPRLRLGRLGLAELVHRVLLVEAGQHGARAHHHAALDRHLDDPAVELGGGVRPGVRRQRARHLQGRGHGPLLHGGRRHRDRSGSRVGRGPGRFRAVAGRQPQRRERRQGGRDEAVASWTHRTLLPPGPARHRQPADPVVDARAQRGDGSRGNPAEGLQLLSRQLQPGAEGRAGRIGEERLAEALVGDQLAQGLFDGALAHGAGRLQGPSPERGRTQPRAGQRGVAPAHRVARPTVDGPAGTVGDFSTGCRAIGNWRATQRP